MLHGAQMSVPILIAQSQFQQFPPRKMCHDGEWNNVFSKAHHDLWYPIDARLFSYFGWFFICALRTTGKWNVLYTLANKKDFSNFEVNGIKYPRGYIKSFVFFLGHFQSPFAKPPLRQASRFLPLRFLAKTNPIHWNPPFFSSDHFYTSFKVFGQTITHFFEHSLIFVNPRILLSFWVSLKPPIQNMLR